MATERNRSAVKSVAIVLAAGSSSRLGQSKQLLKIGDETLLRKTIRTVIDSGVDQVIVILGSEEKAHRNELKGLPVTAVFNPGWEKGMGSSLKRGVRFAVEKFPASEFILVAVCDQPFLTSGHIKKLMGVFQSEKNCPIVASFYAGSPGVPALFHQSIFENLLGVDDEQGAKKLIKDHRQSVCYVDFPAGEVDLDTPEDWKKFISRR
ncbi:MAG TPA: nucleotidyltransferase family protein [Cyclobacteriaceae bacterium]|nr:nucleotidyltransferase family protein [Cyclobacteriaceae bacterium]